MVNVSPFHAMKTLIMTIPSTGPRRGEGVWPLPGSRSPGHSPSQEDCTPFQMAQPIKFIWFSEGNHKETSNCPRLVLQCACLQQCGAAGSSIIVLCGLHALRKQRNLRYDTIDHTTPPNRGERGNLQSCSFSNPWSTRRLPTQ